MTRDAGRKRYPDIHEEAGRRLTRLELEEYIGLYSAQCHQIFENCI